MYEPNYKPFSGYTKEEYNKIVDKLINYTLEIDPLALENEQNIQWYTPLKCIFSRQREKTFVYLPAKFLQQEGYLSTYIDLSAADKYIIPWEKFNVNGKTIEDFFSSLPDMTTPPKYEEMFQYVRCLYNKPGAKIPTDDYGNEKSSQVDNFRKAFKSILNELKKFQSKDDYNKIKNRYFYGVLLILIIKRVLSLIDKGYDINYGSDYLPNQVRVSNLDTKKDNCSISQLDGTKSSLNSHYAEKEYAMFLINLPDIINFRMILECIVAFENCKQIPMDEYLSENYFSKKEIEKRRLTFYFNRLIPLREPSPCLNCSNILCFSTKCILHEYLQLINCKLNKMLEKFHSSVIDFRALLSVYDMYIFKIYVDSKSVYNEHLSIINNIYPEQNESITYLEKLQHCLPINRDILENLLSIKCITKDIKITDFNDFYMLLCKKDSRIKNKQTILDVLFYDLNKDHKLTVIKNNLIIAELIYSYYILPKKEHINDLTINFYFAFISVYIAIRLQDIRIDFLKYPIKDYIQKKPKLKNLILREYKNYSNTSTALTRVINIMPTNIVDFILGILAVKYNCLFELNEENINDYVAYTLEDYNYFYKTLCKYRYEENNQYCLGVLHELNPLVIAN